MEREYLAGLAVFIIALAVLPASFIIYNHQIQLPSTNSALAGWLGTIVSNQNQRELIDNITIGPDRYPPDVSINLSISAANTVIKINPTDKHLFQAYIYKTKNVFSFIPPSYNISSSHTYSEEDNLLTLNLASTNLIIEIYVGTSNLRYINIKNINGMIDLNLTQLINTSLNIDITNGIIHGNLTYSDATETRWTLNLLNGLGTLNITTSQRLNITVDGEVYNGFASLNLYTEERKLTNGTLEIMGDKNHSLSFNLKNGNLNIMITTG